ncbi:hypothetical protein PT974_02852 [Cladobotryum mycophilum]|uniref:Uncharacterized protein n=1 Tax=Cladobotryum mycophilum TaxID=491253 RepID=A0ABR0SZT4_9HYPO
MISTVFAPEVLIVAAYYDLMMARQNQQRSRDYKERDGITWNLAQSYYVNLGGFVIQGNGIENAGYHHPYHLNAEQICELRDAGHLQKLPNITEEEIDAISRHDSLVKVIAVVQILWTVLQILMRAAKGLAISPLEFAVLAFVVCVVVIYALYWEKPSGVRATTTVMLCEDLSDELRKILETRDNILGLYVFS